MSEQMAGKMVFRNMRPNTGGLKNCLSIVFALKPINRFCRGFSADSIVIKSIAIVHRNVKKYERRVNR